MTAAEPIDRIVLTNGGVLQGKIIDESEDLIRIELSDGVVGFQKTEIQLVERNISQKQASLGEGDVHVPTFRSEDPDWPAGTIHRVLLKNGEWVNGRIVKKTEDQMTVRHELDGGGAIELDLDLDQIEKIALWPPPETDDRERLRDFIALYPSLQLMRKGYYTLLSSEQDPADLRIYIRTLSQFYHDFLLHFFDLIDVNQPHEPLDVIVFGTRSEFEQVLREIGYNEKSNLIGFYHFDVKKLVFYNVKTDAAVRQGLQMTNQMRSQVDALRSVAQRSSSSSIGDIPGGVLEQAADEIGRQELQILSAASIENIHVIRHEGGHQLFHLLGITPSGVYSGGWLIEGLATYCEPEPIGDVQVYKLMDLRFELEKNELMPLEYLLNFAQGMSLHKLDPLYARIAYAESWAFIYFLMHQGYREAFFNFLKEMRTQGKDYDSHVERRLLEKHLGKDLKTLEQEFVPFVKKLIAESIDEKVYEDYRLNLISAT